MHVVELLKIFAFGADVEVIKARLPECARQVGVRQTGQAFRNAADGDNRST